MSSWPNITFPRFDPLQDYYQDRDGNRYCVARLLDDSKDLPVFDLPMIALDLSDKPWDGDNLYDLAFHCKRVMQADLTKPILLDWNGVVADGRHRIIKAILEERTTIRARRMTWKPAYCQKETP